MGVIRHAVAVSDPGQAKSVIDLLTDSGADELGRKNKLPLRLYHRGARLDAADNDIVIPYA